MQFGSAAERRTRGAAVLVLASIVSVQCGAALATTLFDEIGTSGAVFLRAAFGALVLVVVTRASALRVREWPHRDVLLLGAAVGILSTAVPYTFEIEALRRLPRATFGVLMSLEPTVAAAIGFIALSQSLDTVEVLAITLVVIASAGALRGAAMPPRD